eukprot:PhF_6_TR9941/c0_g1_i1/m.15123
MQYRSTASKGFLGSDIPNFKAFPFRSTEVLRLYRSFWRVLVKLPLEEQLDAKYKLREAFRRSRHIVGAKTVAKAIQSGYSQLEYWKLIVATNETRAVGGGVPRVKDNGGKLVLKDVPSDFVWEQIREVTAGTLPGMEVRGSYNMSKRLQDRLAQKKASSTPW